MLYLPHYGVPIDYEKSIEMFLGAKEISDLYAEICAQPDVHPRKMLETYHKHPYFNYALGKAALEKNFALLITYIYSVPDEYREWIHFEWKIPHEEYELTFSNAYFVAYFNELYRDVPDCVGRRLSPQGVALRALSYLSYTPWVNFMLPIRDDTVDFFLKMPLYDRDKAFLEAIGDDDE